MERGVDVESPGRREKGGFAWDGEEGDLLLGVGAIVDQHNTMLIITLTNI